MDIFSAEQRSRVMAKIRGKNTRPERILRSALHRLGLRFRIHAAQLPGKPDIVFPRQRVAVFVHGCFWHQHKRCRDGRRPTSNLSYWEPKFARIHARDRACRTHLRRLGWTVLTVWECEIEDNLDCAIALVAGAVRPVKQAHPLNG